MDGYQLSLLLHLVHHFRTHNLHLGLFPIFRHIKQLQIAEGYPHIWILPELRVHIYAMLEHLGLRFTIEQA